MSEGADAPSVAICFPAHDFVPTTFAFDLARMVNVTAANFLNTGRQTDLGYLGVNCITSTYVPNSRQDLVDLVLQDENVDHVLWVDSDMRFPPDALARLLVHNVPIVGINYMERKVGGEYVAVRSLGDGPGEIGVKCPTHADSTGLEEVEAIGMGMCLMQRQVFEALRDPDSREGPWFQHIWMPSKKQNMGEDVYFCKLARQAGFPVLVDHDLSKDCSHTGTFDYRLDHRWSIDAAEAEGAHRA